MRYSLLTGRCNGRSPLTSSVLPGDSQPLLGFVARGPRCQAEASSTWSSTAIRALTSSGGTAGNVAMRTWLRPSFR